MTSGISIDTLEDQAKRAAADPVAFVTDERLALTADRSRVVSYDHREAAFLFKAPGQTVTADEAKRYGLAGPKPTPPAAPASEPEKKEAEPPSDLSLIHI